MHRAQRRNQPEEDAGKQADSRGKAKHASIRAGGKVSRDQLGQQRHAPGCEQGSEGSSQESQQDALGEQLADNPLG